MNVINFDFKCGLVHIDVIAHATNLPSHTHAHNHANHIANHAQIAAAILKSTVPNILNATIKPYIAADSTNAIPNIVTVKKYHIIFSCFHIISIDFSASIHSQILTHNHANHTANHIPI
jgi:hypothetical protein